MPERISVFAPSQILQLFTPSLALHDRTYKHLKELQKLRNEPKPKEPPCVSMRIEGASTAFQP